MAVDWLDLDLRHLATFRVLAQERSFRATAARLRFAQSGISRHISTLERRVGTPLVKRGHGTRGVELTEAGRDLLEHADSILGIVASAERDFAHRHRPRGVALRVATFQSVSATILAPAIAHMKMRDPCLAIDLAEVQDPVAALRAGEVDLAFAEQIPIDSDAAHLVLFEDPYVLAAAPGEAIPGHERAIEITELAALPLVTLKNSCHLAVVEKELADQGIYLRPTLRNDDAMTLQGLAASGAGVALLPRLAVAPTPHVHIREVEPAFRPRSICLIWNRQPAPSPLVRELAERIRQSAKRLRPEGVASRPRALRLAPTQSEPPEAAASERGVVA